VAEINDLSIVDASNISRFPENMAPSAVNDGARALEGLVARGLKDALEGNKDSTGSSDAYVVAANRTLSAYYDGMRIGFHASFANTGAATLNVDSVGAKSITKRHNLALASGDIEQHQYVDVIYSASDDAFQMQNPAAQVGAGDLKTDWINDLSAATVASGDLVAVADVDASNVQKKVTAQSIADLAGGESPRSYLAGLGMTNGTDADHDINIAAGVCRNAANDGDITLSAIVKQIDASWSAGTAAGGLSSGLTVANNTWYHVFAIIVSGAADVGFDTDIDAANLITAHSATAHRRIGAVRTDGSANILGFLQFGDEFLWTTTKNDLSNGTIASTGTALTLTVPTGVRVVANFAASQGTQSRSLAFFPGDLTGFAPALLIPPVGMVGMQNNVEGVGQVRCVTNTSAQVKGFSDGAGNATDASITTYGWTDLRGRDS
jgi:hypothetical protein